MKNFIRQRSKKRAFTLIELFICLSIMVLVMGYFGVKVNEGITTKRFTSACLSLEEKIHFCQRMAISHEMDMMLRLENKKDGIHCLMGSSLEKGFFSKQPPEESTFKHVHFTFDDDIKDQVIIGFSSTGIIFPIGTLHIQSKKLRKSISLHSLNHIQTGVKEIGQEPFHPYELEEIKKSFGL